MSIYQLKPAFQNLLRPGVVRLAKAGVTANQVALAACVISVALGAVLYLWQPPAWAYALVPVWMFLRMAFNAVDGMLAREHGQQTSLGAFLNELTDVVSDAALYLPFVWVLPNPPLWMGMVIFLAALSEYAGALGLSVGASRRYDGPMGKSDRAFVFGALGLLVSLGWAAPVWTIWVLPALSALIALTVVRRIRGALNELKAAKPSAA